MTQVDFMTIDKVGDGVDGINDTMPLQLVSTPPFNIVFSM